MPVFLFLLLWLAPAHQDGRMVGVEPAEPALSFAEDQDDGPLVAPEDLAFVPRHPSRFRHRPALASQTDPYPDVLRRRRVARGAAAVVALVLSGDVPSALAWQLWTACGNRSGLLDAIFTRYIFTYRARDGSLCACAPPCARSGMVRAGRIRRCGDPILSVVRRRARTDGRIVPTTAGRASADLAAGGSDCRGARNGVVIPT